MGKKTFMLVQPQSQIYTLDEYRNLEESAEFRSEYNDGKILPMSGGTIAHNTIIINLIFLFKLALRGTHYRIQSSDLRLWIPQYCQGTYPDIMIIAGDPIFNENRTDEILNPCLIVEVLSKSTQGYDRGDKFLHYRSIPEFREYLLISQSEYLIEHYLNTGEGRWLLQEYRWEEGQIVLDSVGVSLAISEIYEGVGFI